MARNWDDDLLANGQLGRVNTIVESQDLTNSSVESLREIEECVAGLDNLRANALTERIGADGNGNNLAGEDEVDVLDLRV